jgi:hypothetical protein
MLNAQPLLWVCLAEDARLRTLNILHAQRMLSGRPRAVGGRLPPSRKRRRNNQTSAEFSARGNMDPLGRARGHSIPLR